MGECALLVDAVLLVVAKDPAVDHALLVADDDGCAAREDFGVNVLGLKVRVECFPRVERQDGSPVVVRLICKQHCFLVCWSAPNEASVDYVARQASRRRRRDRREE